jgi:hypothetical protein
MDYTECDEIAQRLFDNMHVNEAKTIGLTHDAFAAYVRQCIPDETLTMIDNVAYELRRLCGQ